MHTLFLIEEIIENIAKFVDIASLKKVALLNSQLELVIRQVLWKRTPLTVPKLIRIHKELNESLWKNIKFVKSFRISETDFDVTKVEEVKKALNWLIKHKKLSIRELRVSEYLSANFWPLICGIFEHPSLTNIIHLSYNTCSYSLFIQLIWPKYTQLEYIDCSMTLDGTDHQFEMIDSFFDLKIPKLNLLRLSITCDTLQVSKEALNDCIFRFIERNCQLNSFCFNTNIQKQSLNNNFDMIMSIQFCQDDSLDLDSVLFDDSFTNRLKLLKKDTLKGISLTLNGIKLADYTLPDSIESLDISLFQVDDDFFLDLKKLGRLKFLSIKAENGIRPVNLNCKFKSITHLYVETGFDSECDFEFLSLFPSLESLDLILGGHLQRWMLNDAIRRHLDPKRFKNISFDSLKRKLVDETRIGLAELNGKFNWLKIT
ncbi:hypothetical protein ROZALSC1DRAFT_27961 [Rozella allomycis CSF55]|uniref:F-box domain-containing protein n=1 Tax=Rozella allomycis (strain CSF55) TaxID=988480 RepID=A0A4P9YMW9_ROZAC|nr:hypothetical protein ROZALSC1DRAFT_27961 [Rozella allomycis CSF55]